MLVEGAAVTQPVSTSIRVRQRCSDMKRCGGHTGLSNEERECSTVIDLAATMAPSERIDNPPQWSRMRQRFHRPLRFRRNIDVTAG